MSLIERDQPIQALATHRPDHPLTERVGFRRPHRRLQDAQTHRFHGAIHRRRIDRIAVVDQDAMRGLACDSDAELLDRPVRPRVRRDIPMDDPPSTDFEHDEHVDDVEARSHDDEEVTG